MRILPALLLAVTLLATPAMAQPAEGWVTSWAASVQGPYPVGNPSAQPDQRFLFPDAARGARDQTFRLVVSRALGQAGAAALLQCAGHQAADVRWRASRACSSAARRSCPARNQPVRSAARRASPSRPAAWSGATRSRCPSCEGQGGSAGRKLAVSFHVAGESGPMTWHAKALQTLLRHRARRRQPWDMTEAEAAFPYSTASWFFLDARGHAGAGRHAGDRRLRRFASPTARPPP